MESVMVVSLLPRDEDELHELVERAMRQRPEGLEIRTDHLDLGRRDLAELRRRVRDAFLIVSSRVRGRTSVLMRAASVGVDAIDVDTGCGLVRADGSLAIDIGPGQTVIASFHDDRATPSTAELDVLRSRLGRIGIPKIAVTPRSAEDLRRVCELATRWGREPGPFILSAMGPLAAPLRAVLPALGSVITYVALDEATATAPGQLTLERQRALIGQHGVAAEVRRA